MKVTQQAIAELHSVACGAYGRPAYDGEREAWQTFLADLPRKHFADAVMAAPETWERFPNVRQMKGEILRRMKNADMPRHQPEPVSEIEIDPENRFAKLASNWERESLTLGLDPDKPSPPEISSRRMQEFWRVLDGEEITA